ncbi:hypothetical protein HYX04_00985, partial [Candidatus Woesearchaeota archaeon]|nr:hypothetical protein [Candidatus Woesearchaeota archaeon]
TYVLDNATIIRTGNLSLIFSDRNNSLWNGTTTAIYPRNIEVKVGINTTTPAQTLTVQGTLNVTGAGRTGDLGVTSNGSVGIGTTKPQEKLTLGNSSKFAIEMSIPTNVTGIVGNVTGSNLSTGTYYYKITALDGSGGETMASQEISVTLTIPENNASNITWQQNVNANSYRVYNASSPGGENSYFNTTGASFIHAGSSAWVSGVPPDATTAYNARISGSGGDYLLNTFSIGTGAASSVPLTISGATGDGTGLAIQSNNSVSPINTRMFSSTSAAAGIVGTQTNHPFIIRTADQNRIKIDTSGNIGIGNGDPNHKLELINASDSDLVYLGIANAGLEIRSSSSTGVAYIDFTNGSTTTAGSGTPDFGGRIAFNSVTAEGFDIHTNGSGTPRMVIDRSGNVGIGTTNPREKFVVYGNNIKPVIGNVTNHTTVYGSYDSQANTGLEIAAAGQNPALGDLILSTNNTGNNDFVGSVMFATRGATGAEKRSAAISSQLSADSSTNPSGVLTFLTTNAGTNAERMRITAAGDVGIGTTGPGAKLEVSQTTAGVDALSVVYDNAANTANAVATFAMIQASNFPVMKITSATGGNPTDTHGLNIVNLGAGYGLRVDDVGGDASPFVIDGNGNVGISTTAPTEALIVVGNANITGTLFKGTSAYNNPDIAERMPSTQLLEEGDLAVIDEQNNNSVVKSNKPYQNAIGVVSPNAAMVIGNWRGGFEGYNIALLGRVAVKISLENGPIKKGDALASSSKEGTAMKATNNGRIIGYAMEDYDGSKPAIELEGTKTEQFKARFSRDLGKKKLKEKAKEVIEENELDKSSSPITGNVINEVSLQTDLSNVLEPESSATSSTTETTAEASIVFENNSNVQAFNALENETFSGHQKSEGFFSASGENETTAQNNTTIITQNETAATNIALGENATAEIMQKQPEEQVIDEIDEIEDLEDVKKLYKKRKGKNLEDNEKDFREITEANKEKEKLEQEAKEIEANATAKILMVLSPGWQGGEAAQTTIIQQVQQLDYMTKVNGSVILRLG